MAITRDELLHLAKLSSLQLSEEEILEKRLDWARHSIKDIKRIEARYFSEKAAE